ncbi:MAG: trypsin-like peptidase domain-containing protein [Candidatus Poribacteria bacterium]|nr:trypsin-like peptidase domain-containing protein [Candidatus Poribacteria bacterium]
MFFPNDPTQNNTELYVSEDPRARLGKGIIGQIRYSPDGTQLAVGSSIGIWIYNAHTGKELNLLTGHTKGAGCIAYSPDDHILASGGTVDTGTVCLWDPNTGEHKLILGEHEEFVTCIEFSPDGSVLASGSVDETIQLWDVVTGKCKATLVGHTGAHELMVFSPDGHTLASATNVLWANKDKDDRTIRLWDTETGQQKVILKDHESCIINAIAFSPDGCTLASAHGDNKAVQLWDAVSGKNKATFTDHSDSVFTVAYSPNGTSLVSGSKDGTILLWDAVTGERKATLTGNPKAIAFSPDGSTLAIAGRDKKIKIWDAVSGEHQLTLTEHTDEVYSLVFNPDGRTFAGIGGDSTIRLWDAVTGEHLQTITGHTRSVSSISFSPDGSKFAIAGNGAPNGTSGDKVIRLWNVRSGALQSTLKVPVGRWINHDRTFIDAVSYSPDGKMLASASEDGTIRLWDVESEKPRSTTFEGFRGVQTSEPLQEYSSDGFVLAYSPDGKTLATSSRHNWAEDTTIQLWDAATCKHKTTLTAPWKAKTLYSIAFSPDSRTVAGGGGDGTVYLWDATNGELKTALTGTHGELKTTFTGEQIWIGRRVKSVAFSSDGRTLASGASSWGDGEVCLWDVVSGECKASLNRLAGILSVTFSPDGSVLAVGGTMGVTLWDVHKILQQSTSDDRYYGLDGVWETGGFDVTGRHKATLKGHTHYVSAVAFSPDGRTLASGSIDGTVLLWNITKTPQTSKQIARRALGSIVLMVEKGARPPRGTRGIMGYAKEYNHASGNGFFVKRNLIATHRFLATPPGYFRRKRFGKLYDLESNTSLVWKRTNSRRFARSWMNTIIQKIDNIIYKDDSLTLYHDQRKDSHEVPCIEVEGIAAIDDQLAILRVSDTDVQPLCLSNEEVRIGDTVYVASSPDTFSQGIISRLYERNFFEITAPIPDGCNGCPVLNRKGQVIGVAAKEMFIEKHLQHQSRNLVIPSIHLLELLSKVEASD